MTTIHLVRHGSHDLLGRVLTGRMPGVSLNASGLRDSTAAGRALVRDRLAAIYSSPLERARQTAERIGACCGLSVEIDPALDEIDFGAWTGLPFDTLHEREDWRAFNSCRGTVPIPGGETEAAVQQRMVGAVDRLAARHRGAAIALVGHGDPIKLVLLHALGAPIDAVLRLEVAPASISTLALDGTTRRVLRVNHSPAASG